LMVSRKNFISAACPLQIGDKGGKT
jgi:hypothetical protein